MSKLELVICEHAQNKECNHETCPHRNEHVYGYDFCNMHCSMYRGKTLCVIKNKDWDE